MGARRTLGNVPQPSHDAQLAGGKNRQGVHYRVVNMDTKIIVETKEIDETKILVDTKIVERSKRVSLMIAAKEV